MANKTIYLIMLFNFFSLIGICQFRDISSLQSLEFDTIFPQKELCKLGIKSIEYTILNYWEDNKCDTIGNSVLYLDTVGRIQRAEGWESVRDGHVQTRSVFTFNGDTVNFVTTRKLPEIARLPWRCDRTLSKGFLVNNIENFLVINKEKQMPDATFATIGIDSFIRENQHTLTILSYDTDFFTKELKLTSKTVRKYNQAGQILSQELTYLVDHFIEQKDFHLRQFRKSICSWQYNDSTVIIDRILIRLNGDTVSANEYEKLCIKKDDIAFFERSFDKNNKLQSLYFKVAPPHTCTIEYEYDDVKVIHYRQASRLPEKLTILGSSYMKICKIRYLK